MGAGHTLIATWDLTLIRGALWSRHSVLGSENIETADPDFEISRSLLAKGNVTRWRLLARSASHEANASKEDASAGGAAILVS